MAAASGAATGTASARTSTAAATARPTTAAPAPIASLSIDGSIYDAWTVDHLAVTQAVPEAGTWALMAAGLSAVARRRGAYSKR
jgi:hypothetical protein